MVYHICKPCKKSVNKQLQYQKINFHLKAYLTVEVLYINFIY